VKEFWIHTQRVLVHGKGYFVSADENLDDVVVIVIGTTLQVN
jgi:hypothetical protein